MAQIEQGSVDANTHTFRFHAAGPADGEPVLMLHGFPSTSLLWAPQLRALGEAGYRCVAVDQRGYSPGARPGDRDDYYYPKLASDIPAVADALGWRRFHLVTHDHGAVLGWVVASLYPDRLASFTALSVPHVDAFSEALLHDPAQQAASQYFHVFVTPGSEEVLFTAFVDGLNSTYKALGVPDEYTQDRAEVLSSPEVLRKALWWYNGAVASYLATPPVQPDNLAARMSNMSAMASGTPAGLADAIKAFKDPAPARPALSSIGSIAAAVPVLYCWGSQDNALTRGPAEATSEYVDGAYKFVELDCSHWMTYEKAEEVSKEILEHLARNPLRAAAL